MLTENTHFGAERIGEFLKGCRGVYFLGIGGIHMSSLAHLTHLLGYRTGGTDRVESELTRRLESEGIELNYTHDAKNIEGYDVIVYTVAISADNPEYAAAAAMGLPCISRADYIGYLMCGYRNRIAIAGMHGKSTCTSMCAQVFIGAGADPTVLSGAAAEVMGGAYRIGGKEHFILEACEYRDSFLDFNHNVAVILNIEPEHLDYFSGIGQIKDSFVSFAHIASEGGLLIANADDEAVREVAERTGMRCVTFGLHSPSATYKAINISRRGGLSEFDIVRQGEYLCHVSLALPGIHNVMNALAAAAAADVSGIDAERIGEGLTAFRGARRRMEFIGTLGGAAVYNDYAHHPTEIRATLEGLAAIGQGEVICVFQPHTHSRTAALFEGFAAAFEQARRVVITDIYAARGSGEEYGVSAKDLAIAIGQKAEYIEDMGRIADFLRGNIYPGDKVVIMGAGDIERLIPMLGLERPGGE